MSESRPAEAVLYLQEPTWSDQSRRWPPASRIFVVVPIFIVVSELIMRITVLVSPASDLKRFVDPFTFVLSLIAIIAMCMMRGRWFPYHLVDGIVIGKTGPRWHYRPLPRYWIPLANILREKSRFAVWEQYSGYAVIPAGEGKDGAIPPALALYKTEDNRTRSEAPFAILYPAKDTIRFPYDPTLTDSTALTAALEERFTPTAEPGVGSRESGIGEDRDEPE